MSKKSDIAASFEADIDKRTMECVRDLVGAGDEVGDANKVIVVALLERATYVSNEDANVDINRAMCENVALFMSHCRTRQPDNMLRDIGIEDAETFYSIFGEVVPNLSAMLKSLSDKSWKDGPAGVLGAAYGLTLNVVALLSHLTNHPLRDEYSADKAMDMSVGLINFLMAIFELEDSTDEPDD